MLLECLNHSLDCVVLGCEEIEDVCEPFSRKYIKDVEQVSPAIDSRSGYRSNQSAKLDLSQLVSEILSLTAFRTSLFVICGVIQPKNSICVLYLFSTDGSSEFSFEDGRHHASFRISVFFSAMFPDSRED